MRNSLPERVILFSGIGGQGVQLAAKTLAVAAMRYGRCVMMFGTYGGEMRGGDTDATVVVGKQRLVTPPIIDHAWAAIAMHPKNWPGVESKLLPGGIALINTSVFEAKAQYRGALLEVAATGAAAQADMPQAGSLVALGAFAAATGIVTLQALQDVAEEVLPPYRREYAEANRRALALGFGMAPQIICSAWDALEHAA
jgi:2-oxoglutarate ferredoxin oxidoreductase subunit gamma